MITAENMRSLGFVSDGPLPPRIRPRLLRTSKSDARPLIDLSDDEPPEHSSGSSDEVFAEPRSSGSTIGPSRASTRVRPSSMSTSFRERLERAVARAPAAKRQKVAAQPSASPPGELRPRASRPPVPPPVPLLLPPAEHTRSLPAIVREALRTLEGWAMSSVALVEDEQGRARELVRALEAETRRADEAVRRDAESWKALETERRRHAEELGQVIPSYRRSDEFERDAEEYVRGRSADIVASWLASDAGKETIADESAVAFQVGRYAMQQEIYTALRQKGDAFDPGVLVLPTEMENPEPVNPASGFSLSPLDRGDEPVELVASSGAISPTLLSVHVPDLDEEAEGVTVAVAPSAELPLATAPGLDEQP
ncbi:PREDICTED: uncharacterized protein LOC109158502 [Ipomoea nil]|uniref:uncharacterized protein LOC109158502 n=1 Tax=Ipomoea nil TaxID=35883 RepID=UPI000901FDE2|nr:PREDICTED: uncharacterized protein LOC109158502 [Ipomoea nil]